MPYKDIKKSRESCRKSYYKNYSSRREHYNEYRRILRKEAIEHYGGKCSCCGETNYKFLTIDHMNGGGTQHRKEIGNDRIALWLKKNNYPEDFQILCYNCNCAKAYNKGVCPHKEGL